MVEILLIYSALKRNGYFIKRKIEQAFCGRCRIFVPDRCPRGTVSSVERCAQRRV